MVDEELGRYLDEHPGVRDAWLLRQTLYTGPSRRQLLGRLELSDGAAVLDAGSGFGALAFDFASARPWRVTGLDVDADKIRIAEELAVRLRARGAVRQGAALRFCAGDVYGLPFPDRTFDFVVARFVFQHLSDPPRAAAELCRVARPGGHVCLIDVDDQYTVTYPEESGALAELSRAFQQLQAHRGGDRFVGRKLAHFLSGAGLADVRAAVEAQADFRRAGGGDAQGQFMRERLQSGRDEIVGGGVMAADAFDSRLRELADQPPLWQFESMAQVVAVGRKAR